MGYNIVHLAGERDIIMVPDERDSGVVTDERNIRKASRRSSWTVTLTLTKVP
jgi:hypothetical protein